VFIYENVLKILWGHATNNWNEFNENNMLLKALIKHFNFSVSLVVFHFSKDSKCFQNDIIIYAPLHIIKYNTLARYRCVVPRYNIIMTKNTLTKVYSGIKYPKCQ
jgi:hypothetical protein